MYKTNLEIREALKERGIRQYQLAEMLGVFPQNLSRSLREELPAERKAKILKFIEPLPVKAR